MPDRAAPTARPGPARDLFTVAQEVAKLSEDIGAYPRDAGPLVAEREAIFRDLEALCGEVERLRAAAGMLAAAARKVRCDRPNCSRCTDIIAALAAWNALAPTPEATPEAAP
jgi:hypothetical protein